jgi:hypothetical protein
MASDPTAVTKIYEQLPFESLQQVADSYMAWYVDRVTHQLDDTMTNLRSELRENDQREASYRPTPLELEAIERLQRSGVTAVDLLDRMVEQGDDWLRVTMSRLDHFEKTGLAPKDYSVWCEHALGGAYDWIDHERIGSTPGGGAPRSAPPPRPAAPPPPAQPAPGPQGGNTPSWLASRNNPRASEDGPTGPMPSVAPRGAPMPQAIAPSGAPDDDDNGRRNIFRIFTNTGN